MTLDSKDRFVTCGMADSSSSDSDDHEEQEMLALNDQVGVLSLGEGDVCAAEGDSGRKKRPYVKLSIEQKIKIVQYYEQNKTMDKQEVLEWAKAEFQLKHTPSVSALQRMLKHEKVRFFIVTERIKAVERYFWQSEEKKGQDNPPIRPVDPMSQEFMAISAMFRLTLPDASVKKIDRVENGQLHEEFCTKRHTVRKDIEKLGECAQEPHVQKEPLLLFHGTNALDCIVCQGFLPMLAGTNVGAIYGNGAYFARDASYSDIYAHSLPNGLKQVKARAIFRNGLFRGLPAQIPTY